MAASVMACTWLADAGQAGQFVDDLGPNQRRIHVERHQATMPPVDGVVLERDVDVVACGQRHERRAELGLARQDAGRAEFDTHARSAGRWRQRRPLRQTVDAIDIQARVSDRAADVGQVHRPSAQGPAR